MMAVLKTPPKTTPKPQQRFALSDEVRVQPVSVWKRLLQGRGRSFSDEDGRIIYRVVGSHSQKTLYTLAFTDQNGDIKTGCFFDDELELTSPVDESPSAALEARPVAVFQAGPRSRPSALSERLRATLKLRRFPATA